LRLWIAAVDNRQQWFSPTRCCVGGGHRRGWQIFAGNAIGRQPIALMPRPIGAPCAPRRCRSCKSRPCPYRR
jgi:hypothetical protein